MTAKEVRKKYIEFFKATPRNHSEISSAPLIPLDDPTTLFTSSGMQQLVPFLTGEPHPEGKRLVNSQPCLRVQDIEEVGNSRHTTFFEMLGNWSLGDYFKKEQLPWIWEFFVKELNLPKKNLWVSVFEGTKDVPKDEVSANVWKKIGVPEKKIFYYGVKENWWSRSGTPAKMPEGEIGGPDSEIFFEFSQVNHNPQFGKECHPNCQCGRFLEIGNSVFIQYMKKRDGLLEELPQKNVDFGGGLERLTAAANNDPEIFNIDLFEPILKKLISLMSVVDTNKMYKVQDIPLHPILHEMKDKSSVQQTVRKSSRIIVDHTRASVIMASYGVFPGNKKQPAVLRRLIRRAVKEGFNLGLKHDFLSKLVKPTINVYSEILSHLVEKERTITEILREEESKFRGTIEKGTRELNKYIRKHPTLDENEAKQILDKNLKQYYISRGDFIAKLYPPTSLATTAGGTVAGNMDLTYGLPFEFSQPLIKNWSDQINTDRMQKVYDEFVKLHKDLSKKSSAGMFKGGLADKSEEATKFHTTTHLLHSALRKVLGDHVQQKGSNITAERLRFDFTHKEKLSDEEIEKVEKLINEQIKKDLPVSHETKTYKEAIGEGALAFFGERYGEKVKVYTIGGSEENFFSKEVCGGPHVKSTGELGRVKIKKQEKIGSGLVRIYASIDQNSSTKSQTEEK